MTEPIEDVDDWADRHVARWRDHWIDIDFDDDVEAIFARISRLAGHLKRSSQAAVAEVGLQDFEYDTLHHLMIRETPGSASPSDLARDLGITGAGTTGRLDTLEKAGWIQRRPLAGDRRRLQVEVTRAGVAKWREAMARRGSVEDEVVAELSVDERRQLAGLLKRLTLAAGDP